jgi:hypothetical protein
MRKLILVFLVLVCFFVASNVVYAENSITFSDSNKSIMQAMELSLKSNSLSYLYAQENSRIDSIYKAHAQPDSLKLKSPTAALLIALVPGSVVHGAGHFYAGKSKAGFLLLGVEIIGAGLLYLSALGNLPGNTRKGNTDGTAFIGLTLIVGSWLYDIIEAPFTVKRNNQKILGKDPFEL